MYMLAGVEIILPRHELDTARSPDGVRRWTRDGRVNHDTFHDRESMHKLKSDGIEDDDRERKHDELKAKRRELRES